MLTELALHQHKAGVTGVATATVLRRPALPVQLAGGRPPGLQFSGAEVEWRGVFQSVLGKDWNHPGWKWVAKIGGANILCPWPGLAMPAWTHWDLHQPKSWCRSEEAEWRQGGSAIGKMFLASPLLPGSLLVHSMQQRLSQNNYTVWAGPVAVSPMPLSYFLVGKEAFLLVTRK